MFILPDDRGTRRILFFAGLAILELTLVVLAYMKSPYFECQQTGLVNLCRGLRAMAWSGVFLTFAVFSICAGFPSYWRSLQSLAAEHRGAPAALGANLAGTAVFFAPAWFHGAAGWSGDFETAVFWLIGGALMASAGALFWLLSPRGWFLWLTRSNVWLPLLLLGVLLSPALYSLTARIWNDGPLTELTFQLIQKVLSLTGSPSQIIPETRVIYFEGFGVRIESGCSGIEGILLVSFFMLIYSVLMRGEIRQMPYWTVLFPIAVAFSWSANVLRISALILIGARVSPELAVEGFHSYAGWLVFACISFVILVLAHNIPALQSTPVRKVPAGSSGIREDDLIARIVPFIVMMMSGILATAFWVEAETAYPLRSMLMAGALVFFWPALRAMPLRAGPLDWAAGALVGVFWVLLDQSVQNTVTDPAPEYGVLWIMFRLIGTILLVPVIEELFFRGYVLRRLLKENTLHKILALAVSSLLFGLMHDRILAGTLAGVVFGLLYIRTGRIGSAVQAHMIANAVVAVAALMADDWALI